MGQRTCRHQADEADRQGEDGGADDPPDGCRIGRIAQQHPSDLGHSDERDHAGKGAHALQDTGDDPSASDRCQERPRRTCGGGCRRRFRGERRAVVCGRHVQYPAMGADDRISALPPAAIWRPTSLCMTRRLIPKGQEQRDGSIRPAGSTRRNRGNPTLDQNTQVNRPHKNARKERASTACPLHAHARNWQDGPVWAGRVPGQVIDDRRQPFEIAAPPERIVARAAFGSDMVVPPGREPVGLSLCKRPVRGTRLERGRRGPVWS